MSHPKQAKLFRAWTAAMLDNAQVGTPDYGKKASRTGLQTKTKRRKRRRKRKKKTTTRWRMNHG